MFVFTIKLSQRAALLFLPLLLFFACGGGEDSNSDGGGDASGGGFEINLDWVAIPGGAFNMGSETGDIDEVPVHKVTVPGFEITKTEITVAQYRRCVEAGLCSEPDTVGPFCSDYSSAHENLFRNNWVNDDRENHPINCVSWFQAVAFCEAVGGRLPSESEWEYAARSAGKDIKYPWGNEEASCDYAIMADDSLDSGCGKDRTWEVCSKTTGNTEQGLCDMAGNVLEWIQDWRHDSYNGAPADGSAWESPAGELRMERGGCFAFYDLRVTNRFGSEQIKQFYSTGIRCAR